MNKNGFPVDVYSIGDYGDMIADKVRMDPYVYAMKSLIRPDSVVVDIGTGAGIHALMACKFGARKVYAIEPNEAIHLAKELALVNGYADQIEFMHDLSTRVTLPEKADLIVSDLRGVLPFYGGHIPSIIDARERHLAPGGRLIPKRDTVWVSLVEARNLYNEIAFPWDHPYGLNMEMAQKIVLNNWYEETVDAFGKRSFLTKPRIWTEIEYITIDNPDVSASNINLQALRDGVAHGLLMWFDAEIADGIHIFNSPQAAKAAEVYGCGFFPLLEPAPVKKGDTISLDIRADLVGDQYNWHWHTRIESGNEIRSLKANFEQSTSLGCWLMSLPKEKLVSKMNSNGDQVGELETF